MNKKILIGAGILAAAGIAYYLYNKNKSSQNNNIDWKKTDAEIAKEFGLDLEQVVEMRKKTEGKSNAMGNPNNGISFKKGKVILNSSGQRYDYLKPVNTPAQFSGAAGRRLSGSSVGVSPIGSGYLKRQCTEDEKKEGKFNCNCGGVKDACCCNAVKTATTGTVTVSSFNGYNATAGIGGNKNTLVAVGGSYQYANAIGNKYCPPFCRKNIFGNCVDCRFRTPVESKGLVSNAIGRRTLGVSRGNLGGGIVNVITNPTDWTKWCCPDGTRKCQSPVLCKTIAGEPKEMPKDVA